MAELGSAENPYDVIIIGAGMSGLAAADALLQANAELRIQVIERAADEGGRVNSPREKPGYDFGAAYFGPLQTYTMAYVRRFDLEFVRNWMPADKLSLFQRKDGKIVSFYGENFPVTATVRQAIGEIETLVLGVKAELEHPWRAPRADYWDSLTVKEWGVRSLPDPPGAPTDPEERRKIPEVDAIDYARELLAVAVRSAFSVEPDELSFLYLLHYSATCNSFLDFENVNSNGDCFRLVGGMEQIARKTREAVGDVFAFNCEVQQVSQGEHLVHLRTEERADGPRGPKGTTRDWYARRVIVAMSPASQVDIAKEMHGERKAACEAYKPAHTVKAFVTYKFPWWREHFTGYGLSAKGPIDWVMDNLSRDDSGLAYPTLMCFVCGDVAKRWTDAQNGAWNADAAERDDRLRDVSASRKREVLEHLAQLFGDPRANDDGLVVDYQDALDVGMSPIGPAHVLGPEALTARWTGTERRRHDQLRAPSGRLHWAGSELATNWVAGYVNGALQSGIRAAGEVIGLLEAEAAGGPTTGFLGASGTSEPRRPSRVPVSVTVDAIHGVWPKAR